MGHVEPKEHQCWPLIWQVNYCTRSGSDRLDTTLKVSLPAACITMDMVISQATHILYSSLMACVCLYCRHLALCVTKIWNILKYFCKAIAHFFKQSNLSLHLKLSCISRKEMSGSIALLYDNLQANSSTSLSSLLTSAGYNHGYILFLHFWHGSILCLLQDKIHCNLTW